MEQRQWRIAQGDFQAAMRARHEFVQFLREHAIAESDFSAAELVFGELVTNAVRHTRTEAVVDLNLDHDARMSVREDGASGWPGNVQPAPIYALGGRGLYIVATLAAELRFEQLSPGLVVSVALPVTPKTTE